MWRLALRNRVTHPLDNSDSTPGTFGRVALVQYRDNIIDPPAEVVVPFTSHMTEFQDGPYTLSAAGVGDDPEALLQALMFSLDDLSWPYGAPRGRSHPDRR